MKTYLLLFAAALNSAAVLAQVAINPNGNPANSDAALDVDFSDKGFLPPRVALSASSSPAPLNAHHEGMVVYNTVALNDVVPGLYYNDGTAWKPLRTEYSAGQGIEINGNVISTSGGGAFECGTATVPVSHDPSDGASAEMKNVTYGTVSMGGNCWIDRNLGASVIASSSTDNTESAGGWFWQFNRKQGYKHTGSVRTPNTTWITSINEDSNWTAANDPCLETLGQGWRVPLYSEFNVLLFDFGISTYLGWYSSPLKMHAAGRLASASGSLVNRGLDGRYMTASQSANSDAHVLVFGSQTGNAMSQTEKASGFSVRCIRD
jgi:uncharacterized protein (TIGR02145 family)